MSKKILNFWIEEELQRRLKVVLAREGLQMSKVMVGLITKYVEEKEGYVPPVKETFEEKMKRIHGIDLTIN